MLDNLWKLGAQKNPNKNKLNCSATIARNNFTNDYFIKLAGWLDTLIRTGWTGKFQLKE
jgi:hypothetical protein